MTAHRMGFMQPDEHIILLDWPYAALSDDDLRRLTCPIGLPGVGGKRPAEIAIAVAAELLQLRQARRSAPAGQ